MCKLYSLIFWNIFSPPGLQTVVAISPPKLLLAHKKQSLKGQSPAENFVTFLNNLCLVLTRRRITWHLRPLRPIVCWFLKALNIRVVKGYELLTATLLQLWYKQWKVQRGCLEKFALGWS